MDDTIQLSGKMKQPERGPDISDSELLAIVLERAGGQITIPEDLFISMLDRQCIVEVDHRDREVVLILKERT